MIPVKQPATTPSVLDALLDELAVEVATLRTAENQVATSQQKVDDLLARIETERKS